ncbi:hypothetical protein [Flavobacterium collinsii]|jgi:hypothetical protein|uniref:Uncharacterized protein n=1 Tax=Flavobacterium collinsii TaxID=1114861 RepID=A0A9W4XFL5_9FLAO|nr:hypothetical protein [Flavobacterium collinsii]CAA9201537.1 hypothetical protein FLACOL7796_03815 [Flavobacterium collinsii]CAI2768344.1 conserved protein of unknown function [Flavobacterium collinsii]
MIKKVTILIIVLLFINSCGKQETNSLTPESKYEYDSNSEQYSKASDTFTQYENTVKKKVEQTTDELFEVYHYIYSKGNVVEAETNVLFVDGKNDELQIIIDMPNGKTYEYNLADKVSLGILKGMDSYMYTSDNNEKINVFFKDGRKMMGMTSGKEDFVFMNISSYKE